MQGKVVAVERGGGLLRVQDEEAPDRPGFRREDRSREIHERGRSCRLVTGRSQDLSERRQDEHELAGGAVAHHLRKAPPGKPAQMLVERRDSRDCERRHRLPRFLRQSEGDMSAQPRPEGCERSES